MVEMFSGPSSFEDNFVSLLSYVGGRYWWEEIKIMFSTSEFHWFSIFLCIFYSCLITLFLKNRWFRRNLYRLPTYVLPLLTIFIFSTFNFDRLRVKLFSNRNKLSPLIACKLVYGSLKFLRVLNCNWTAFSKKNKLFHTIFIYYLSIYPLILMIF